MRTIVCLAILLAAVCVINGSKAARKEFKSKYELKKLDRPSANPFHYDRKHGGGRRMKAKHLMKKHHGMKSVHDEWMKVPMSNKACKLACPHGEFCVASRRSGDEICVSRKQFKEGRQMFKSFHERKKLFKGDMKGNDLSLHGGHMKDDLLVADRMKDVYDLVKDYKKATKHDRPKNLKSVTVKKLDLLLKEATDVQECRPRELEELKIRLTGYFDMLHTTSRIHRHRANRRKHHRFSKDRASRKLHKMHKRVKRQNTIEIEIHGHCKCSKSVMWDFRKMDSDEDGHLNHEEVTLLARNRREPCMKPLMQSCDKDKDGKLAGGEWCCCLADIVAPCAEKKRLVDKEDWIPRCDKEGYYEREQCHEKTGNCWCVDLNGNAIPHTKQMGGAHCGKYGPNGKPIDEQM